MKTIYSISLLVISLLLILSCNDQAGKTEKSNASYTPNEYNNTKGYWENGKIITEFNCPDDKSYPPVDLKSWDKIPVVNGRLPTYEETMNGTSIHHYGEKANPDVKPYSLTLPKLAYHRNPMTNMDELVVVIQIVQTAEDTIVGFRYLTGGCGGSLFHDYRFLTDEEVKKVVGP
ncbi:MAG: hypothetical protein NT126_10890 [Bacteroidetes bacterium]|nr:hypothetical protein [Bacteroidota bacterium]